MIVGTCGFSRSRRAIFDTLDAVEIQKTFYDPPPKSWLERLRSEAPSGFIFTIKAWMLITHKYNKALWRRLKRELPGKIDNYGFFQDTEEVWWAWSVTLEAARAVGAEAIVLQSPASFKPASDNIARVENFFSKAPREGRILAWEPRGEWWDRPDLLEKIAKDYDVVISGDYLRGRVPPYHTRGTGYARLHGLGGREVNYKYKYTREDLERLRDILERLARDGVKTVYVMFNNVYSYSDALEFKRLLAGSPIK